MAKKNEHGGLKAGLGLVAIAAAAGAYYFYGKGGAARRKHLKSWSVKASGEVMERIENLSDLSEDGYKKIVNEVTAKYKKLSHVAPKELAAFSKELMSHWSSIKSHLKK